MGRRGWFALALPVPLLWVTWRSGGRAVAPPLHVPASEPAPGVAPGRLALWLGRAHPPAALSVAGEAGLRVTVLDEAEAPVAGALVDPSLLEGDLLAPPLPQVTDAAGHALLRLALPVGGHAHGTVTASAAGDRRATDEVAVDFPGSGELSLTLSAAVHLRGRVRVDGVPAPGATLEARWSGTPSDATPVAATGCGAGGLFDLALSDPGSVDLVFHQGVLSGAKQHVQVLARTRDVELEIHTGAIDLDIRGTDGRPLAGVSVLTSPERAALGESDAAGHVSVRAGVQRGYVQLLLEHEGLEPLLEGFKPGARHAVMSPALEVFGRVIAPPGALIQLWLADLKYNSRSLLATLQGPGPFRAGLPVGRDEGRYDIVVQVEGVGTSLRHPVDVRRGVPADAGLLSVATARGHLHGTVRNQDGSAPSGALIHAKPQWGDAEWSVPADARGQFDFELPLDVYQVSASVGEEELGHDLVRVGPTASEVALRGHWQYPPLGRLVQREGCRGWGFPFRTDWDEDESDFVVVDPESSGLQGGDRVVAVQGHELSFSTSYGLAETPFVAAISRPADGTRFTIRLAPVCSMQGAVTLEP